MEHTYHNLLHESLSLNYNMTCEREENGERQRRTAKTEKKKKIKFMAIYVIYHVKIKGIILISLVKKLFNRI